MALGKWKWKTAFWSNNLCFAKNKKKSLACYQHKVWKPASEIHPGALMNVVWVIYPTVKELLMLKWKINKKIFFGLRFVI